MQVRLNPRKAAKRLILFAGVLIAAAAIGSAQQPAVAPPIRITIEEAIRRATVNDPERHRAYVRRSSMLQSLRELDAVA